MILTKKYNNKGMICSRCLKVLSTELKLLGVEVVDVHLGSIQFKYDSQKVNFLDIINIIQENEFDILRDKESILAEQTKIWIIDFIWNTDHSEILSDFLTQKTEKNYQMLSRNFSEIYGQTIERFFIKMKIERVKELIEYNELNYSEIAYNLGYQNCSALSRQFKKETGMTMSTYKKTNTSKRIPLNEI